MNEAYLQTARLLVRIAPLVFRDDTFALKGGTAINLFVRDMPRLSVDLDLVVRDHQLARSATFERISASLKQIQRKLEAQGMRVRPSHSTNEIDTKLFVREGDVEVKIEVNPVLRGTVDRVRLAPLSDRAQQELLAEIELPVVATSDLYAGKLVAALDRQHPRDLFDVKLLLANEGITREIGRAFVVYLACHNRPLHEVLFSKPKDLRHDFEAAFIGMTREHVDLDELYAARSEMQRVLHETLTDRERAFLISLVHAEPDWDLLDIPHAVELPALTWKLRNLLKLRDTDPERFGEQARLLEAGFRNVKAG